MCEEDTQKEGRWAKRGLCRIPPHTHALGKMHRNNNDDALANWFSRIKDNEEAERDKSTSQKTVPLVKMPLVILL